MEKVQSLVGIQKFVAPSAPPPVLFYPPCPVLSVHMCIHYRTHVKRQIFRNQYHHEARLSRRRPIPLIARDFVLNFRAPAGLHLVSRYLAPLGAVLATQTINNDGDARYLTDEAPRLRCLYVTGSRESLAFSRRLEVTVRPGCVVRSHFDEDRRRAICESIFQRYFLLVTRRKRRRTIEDNCACTVIALRLRCASRNRSGDDVDSFRCYLYCLF